MVSLFELQEHIRRIVALNFPQPLWITAEIAQIGESKGHYYLDLVQKSEDSEEVVAQAQAALWAGEYRQLLRRLGMSLQMVLREGQEVKIQVRPEFHERYGLKLHIVDVDPAFTLGQLDLQRRQTVQNLREQGLFDLNRQRALPRVLQRIALISSETAAGKQDFIRQLAENQFGYHFEIQFFPAAVQGKDAGSDIISALAAVAATPGRFDCVVLVRGGGSRLDLSAFDGFDLCAAVARMPLPVLAGIGHDVDESVLDLVACRSLKTPTAVAEYLIQHNMQFEGGVLELSAAIRDLAAGTLRSSAQLLEQSQTEARWAAVQRLRSAGMELQYLAQQAPVLAQQMLKNQLQKLDQWQTYCLALHPGEVLRRGYSITTLNGMPISDASAVSPGDLLETRLKDGVVWSKVLE